MVGKADLALASLNNLSRLWSISCPELSSTWPCGDWGRGIMTQSVKDTQKTLVGSKASGLVYLYMKAMLVGRSFTVFKNWLTLGRMVPPGSERPQDVKA